MNCVITKIIAVAGLGNTKNFVDCLCQLCSRKQLCNTIKTKDNIVGFHYAFFNFKELMILNNIKNTTFTNPKTPESLF